MNALEVLASRPKAKEWTNQRATWAHAKRDGWRMTVVYDFDGTMTAYGRDVEERLEFFKRWPKLALSEWANLIRRYGRVGSIFDGELWMPGKKASEVARILASDKPYLLQYDVFAMPFCAGFDMRDSDIEAAMYVARDRAKMRWAPMKRIRSPFTKDEALADLEPNSEGWVLKQRHWGEWYKLKFESTVDAVVTDVKWGDGKFIGLVGSLVCSVYDDHGKLVEIARAGGMSDDERERMTDDHDEGKLIGRVVELTYQYVGAGGRLRHPRFKCWRPDKPANECRLDDMRVF